MNKILVSPLDIALRFRGIHETPGDRSTAMILAMIQSVDPSATDDVVPWCSAFVYFPFFLLDLPRSKSLRARSWLSVGTPITIEEAEPGFDIVVLKRGPEPQPGPEDQNAPGHVMFYTGYTGDLIEGFGGNQSDAINFAKFKSINVLSIQRILPVQSMNKQGG